jgi:hypothetical protein
MSRSNDALCPRRLYVDAGEFEGRPERSTFVLDFLEFFVVFSKAFFTAFFAAFLAAFFTIFRILF